MRLPTRGYRRGHTDEATPRRPTRPVRSGAGATEGKATDEESPRLPTRLPHGRISKSHRPSFEYTHHILNTQASRNGISDRLLDDGRYSGQGFTRGGSRLYYITCRSPAARWLAHVRLPFARLTPAYRSLGRSVGRSVGWPYRILPCSSTRHGPGAVEGTRAVSTDDARQKAIGAHASSMRTLQSGSTTHCSTCLLSAAAALLVGGEHCSTTTKQAARR